MSALVFVDTNIFLDFYRDRGGDASLELLKHVDDHHERVITTSQVEMEYKKNRQSVILATLRGIKTPDWNALTLPAYLRSSQSKKMIDKAKKDVDSQSRRLKTKVERLLRNPSQNDPMYKILQRLFRADKKIHLTRNKEIRFQIREAAQKRFQLGYPPRKNKDTSFGDAINWEWIIHVAAITSDDIVIVSRDGDYGIDHAGNSILNDWLRQEFKERVGRQRNIQLTGRLSEAFELASISVSATEAEAERKLIEDLKTERVVGRVTGQAEAQVITPDAIEVKLTPEEYRTWLRKQGLGDEER